MSQYLVDDCGCGCGCGCVQEAVWGLHPFRGLIPVQGVVPECETTIGDPVLEPTTRIDVPHGLPSSLVRIRGDSAEHRESSTGYRSETDERALRDAWIATRQRIVKRSVREALTDDGPAGFRWALSCWRPDVVQKAQPLRDDWTVAADLRRCASPPGPTAVPKQRLLLCSGGRQGSVARSRHAYHRRSLCV